MVRLMILVCFTLHCCGLWSQQLEGSMAVKGGFFSNGTKVVMNGRVYRPSGAAQLCHQCSDARDHFRRAKRLRIGSLILSSLGISESLVSALNIEDDRAFGIAHGAVGGAMLTWAAERGLKVQHEVKSGVDAYNRCQFLDPYLR